MVARRNARAKADNTKDRSVRNGGAYLLAGRVCDAIVVDRKSFARPDHAVKRAVALRHDVLDGFVDQYLGAALIVMAGNDAANIQAHRSHSYGTCCGD